MAQPQAPPAPACPEWCSFKGWIRPEVAGRFLYLAKCPPKSPDGEPTLVVVKGIRRSSTSIPKYVLSEAISLRKLYHAHIPQFIRVERVDDGEHGAYLAIVMEYVDGRNLDDLMETLGPLNENRARWIFQQMVLIIDYLHVHHNIMHRDLKLSNFIAWQKDLGRQMITVSLCDFGWAKQRGRDPTITKTGTEMYIAPEVLSSPAGTRYDGKVSDIFSLGVCLFKLLFAQFPRIQDEHCIPAGVISPECAHLLRRLLQRDPAQRITLEEIWADPWFNHDLPATRQYNQERRMEAEGRIIEQGEDQIAAVINEMWGGPVPN